MTYNLSTTFGACDCDPWETVIDWCQQEESTSPCQLTTLYVKILPSICFISYIFSILDMSLSPSASFLLLYNSALQDYTTQTGTNLIDHPFTKQLEKCESVDSISSLLQENLRRFYESRKEDGKIMKSLKCAVHVLHALSTSTVLGEGVGLVRPKSAIHISYPQCILYSHSHPQRQCLLHLQSYSR